MARSLIIFFVLSISAALAYHFYGRNAYYVWFVFPELREKVTQKLLDPKSVQFRSETLRGNVLCGELNAKNLQGAYTGFSRYISGPGVRHIEGLGWIGEGEVPTHFIIAQADAQIAEMRHLLALRKSNADMPMPSEAEVRERARRRMFDSHWKTYCAGG